MSRFVCENKGCNNVDILELVYPQGKMPGVPYLCSNCAPVAGRQVVQPVQYDPERDAGAPDIVNRPSGIALG